MRRAVHHEILAWLKQLPKPLTYTVGIALAIVILVQVFYPTDRMPLYASVDGVNVSGWLKSDAIKKLNTLANNQDMTVVLGKTGQTFNKVKPSKIGLTVTNQARIQAADYPFYMRIIPTSIVWFGLAQHEAEPSYRTSKSTAKLYVESKVGKDCVIPPENATLQLKGDSLAVEPAKLGGSCESNKALVALTSVRPTLGKPTTLTIPVVVAKSDIDNSSAQKLANTLNKNSKGGLKLKVADKQLLVPQGQVLSWLVFAAKDKQLAFTVSPEKAKPYLSKNVLPEITKPAGVTKVTTLDFAEISRMSGAAGQTLATAATLGQVADVLSGTKDIAIATVASVQPVTQYTRSYTKTSNGIAAQARFYDEDNKGVFGVSFSELGGSGLSGQHNGDRQFVTASTYKLFVAFSTLRRVDAGTMKWTDANIAGGRNLSVCFSDMIVKSDNPCAEALIKKIGAKGLNADIKLIGLNNSGFRADNNVTTANDLALYLTKLETAKLPIKSDSRNRLLTAMKGNIYRQGIPGGASGQTADKVGFIWTLLHDAAIVYSPKGTYVLVIMTDGSTWANIADLTRKIEALR